MDRLSLQSKNCCNNPEGLSDEDREWVEQFYTEWERTSGYSRPVDYLDRALRVLRGDLKNRNTVKLYSYTGRRHDD